MCSMSVLCPLCAVPSFNSIDALQQRLIKAANGPLSCPFPQCTDQFLGLDKLTIHLFSHTSLMSSSETPPAIAPPVAPVVPVSSTTQAISAPSKRRGKKSRPKAAVEPATIPTPTAIPIPAPVPATPPARCDICEFSFRNEELRNIHFRLVHENADGSTKLEPGQQQEPYKCHLCSKTFRMKGSLRVHLKVLHTKGGVVSNSGNSGGTGSSSPGGGSSSAINGSGNINNPKPKISICDRIRHKEATASSNTNGNAVANAGNATAGGNGNQPYALSGAIGMLKQEIITPTDASTTTTEYGSTPKNWECDVCTKLFTTKYFLKKHKRLHTGEMPYTCQFCARTFTFQQSYHKHLLYHSEVKPHACTICGRAFKELSTLHNHQRIHSGEKPFKCEVCGKCFRQRVSFLVHTRIHTGVMPYKCEMCQKTFRYKVSLRTHKCSASTGQEEELAQTPEQFIKALLESNPGVDHATATHTAAAHNSSVALNGGEQEALLSQSIDDIVVESCQKLGICGVDSPQQQQPPLVIDNHAQVHFDGSNSPLQQLQNLRLYSPQQSEQQSSDGELFQRFLMDAS